MGNCEKRGKLLLQRRYCMMKPIAIEGIRKLKIALDTQEHKLQYVAQIKLKKYALNTLTDNLKSSDQSRALYSIQPEHYQFTTLHCLHVQNSQSLTNIPQSTRSTQKCNLYKPGYKHLLYNPAYVPSLQAGDIGKKHEIQRTEWSSYFNIKLHR